MCTVPQGYSSSDKQTAHDTLERVRSVVMASIGSSLQQPARFSPQLGYRSLSVHIMQRHLLLRSPTALEPDILTS